MAKKKTRKTKRAKTQTAPIPAWLHLALAGAVLVVTILVYINTVHFPFQFDDLHRIRDNENIRSFSSVFSEYPFYKGNRTVVNLSLWFNYALGSKAPDGGPAVEGMHLFNILFHAFNGILVYFIALVILREYIEKLEFRKKEPLQTENKSALFINRHAAPIIAFFAALIFTLHPIQTQSVTYIIQRAEILATFFSLAALLVYIILIPAKSMLRFGLLTVSIAVLYALGLESKEWIPVLPLLMLFTEFIFFVGANPKRHWKRLEETGTPIFILIVMTAIFLFNLNRTYRGDLDAGFGTSSISHGNYALSQFNVVAYYVKLIFLPTALRLDYNFPVVASFFTFPTILTAAFLLLLLVAGIFTIKRSPVFSFSVLWFFIAVAPSSGAIPISDLIFEHRLYLPLVGFSILAAYMVWRTFQIRALRKFSHAAFIVLLTLSVIYAVATIQRNKVWSTPESLWEDSAAKSPGKARPHANLGLRYLHMFKDGQTNASLLDKAEKHLKEAVRLGPDNPEPIHNLGLVYAAKAETGISPKTNLEQAREMYLKSIKAHEKMIAETEKRLKTQAKYDSLLEEALNKQLASFNKKTATVYHDLAISWEHNDSGKRYGEGFNVAKAAETWDKAIEYAPDDPNMLWNKTAALVNGGMIEDAAKALKSYIEKTGDKTKPDQFYSNGIVAAQKNDFRRAKYYLQTALIVAPDHPAAPEARKILGSINPN